MNMQTHMTNRKINYKNILFYTGLSFLKRIHHQIPLYDLASCPLSEKNLPSSSKLEVLINILKVSWDMLTTNIDLHV